MTGGGRGGVAASAKAEAGDLSFGPRESAATNLNDSLDTLMD